MEHVEVHRAHLLTVSLLQVGVIVLGAVALLSLIVGLVIWRRSRRSP